MAHTQKTMVFKKKIILKIFCKNLKKKIIKIKKNFNLKKFTKNATKNFFISFINFLSTKIFWC